jgi:protein-tyrosine kinase
MSIIEQATKRLEELARAGVDVPWAVAGLPERSPPGAAATGPSPEPTPVSTVRRLETAAPSQAGQARVAAAAPVVASALASGKRSASVQIDLERLERSGYLVPTLARSELAEEFRQIKRPLLHHAQTSDPATTNRASLIMVTSAVAGEGKTFCAINLAMSIAMEVDTSVLLVDADVVRPSIPARLGLPPSRGLLDVLADPGIDLSEVMLRTNVPKLSVLPAGTANARATELLTSDLMDRLLTELATKYSDRVVIFDAPPLLLTTEGKVLASRVGQVLMVVAASQTPRATVAQAFAAVEGCPVVVSLLNRCRDPLQVRNFGYYYT